MLGKKCVPYRNSIAYMHIWRICTYTKTWLFLHSTFLSHVTFGLKMRQLFSKLATLYKKAVHRIWPRIPNLLVCMNFWTNKNKFYLVSLGSSINNASSEREGGGQKLPILLSKKTTKRGGGGQKSPILRQHSLWTAP